MKKVVILGGGHGLSVLLKGLKLFPIKITAVVTVADNGSSTGRLREEFKIPAVGDLRNVLISLSESEPLFEKLFQYRFESEGALNGHSIGNLLLAALIDIKGNLMEAVSSLGEILNLKGKVLPLTEDVVNLVAYTNNGETLIGENNIRKSGKDIKRLAYDLKPKVLDKVLEAINEADLIILGLGSLYTSILPHLICEEIVEAIKLSNAKKIYICNAMTEKGETDGFKVSDHLKVLESYLGADVLNAVLVNTRHIDIDVQERYKKLEESEPVSVDEKEIKKHKIELLKGDLVVIQDKMVRHDPIKTAFIVFSYLLR